MSILDFFPLEKPRPSQAKVIEAIDAAFKSGKRFVILEAPVGSGKSAIAMTFARAVKGSHIITPRKSLQDQYYEDFQDDIVLMKGRNAYPCTLEATPAGYRKVIKAVVEGRVKPPAKGEDNCANAPCRNSEAIWQSCTSNQGDCPYSVAIKTADEHHSVVHNVHSFIFQSNFAGKFSKRDLMIVDEAHEIEGVIREFIIKKIHLKRVIPKVELPVFTSMADWKEWLLSSNNTPEESEHEVNMKNVDPEYRSDKDVYLDRVEDLSQSFSEKALFSVRSSPIFAGNKEIGVSLEFVPHSIGQTAHNLLFNYGDKVLLMSGTIYDHNMYCRGVGINPDDAVSIRVPSAFPIQNRPVYLKPKYQTNTSFATWRENFEKMIGIIDSIQNIFKDAKGLIHAPSYDAAGEICSFVPGHRLVTHGKHDFQERLEAFYASTEPLIFVSPVCQQGVDFKDDRARFQILTRVPYLNTSDQFVGDKMKTDFNWYNYQALIIFGQQLGRPVRSETDYGATFLLDERFNQFISKNRSKIPKWSMDSFVWK